MAQYTVGQVVAITVTFTDVLGIAGPALAPIDPGTVTFTYQAPGAADATIVPTHVSTGIYRVLLNLTVAGSYLYKWTSTNNGSGVGQGAYQSSLYAVATAL